jgi:hypothetical protein
MQNIKNMKLPSKTFKTSSFFLAIFLTLNLHHQRISNGCLNLQIMVSYQNSINAKLKNIYFKITFEN